MSGHLDTPDWSVPWGILSDAHGNPFGVRACIDALAAAGARQLFFLGDAVGYLPLDGPVLDVLARVGASCVLGNHDAMLLGRAPLDEQRDVTYGLAAARHRLDSRAMEQLSSWPVRRVLRPVLDGGSVLMVHGGPANPLLEYVYPDSSIEGFDRYGHRCIMLGHTHRPFVRRAGRTLVVNVGSCGLPRDIGHLASCALYRPESNEAEILRVPFDPDSLLRAAREVAPVADSVMRCLRRGGDASSAETR